MAFPRKHAREKGKTMKAGNTIKRKGRCSSLIEKQQRDKESISKAMHDPRKTLYQREAASTVVNYSKNNTKYLQGF